MMKISRVCSLGALLALASTVGCGEEVDPCAEDSHEDICLVCDGDEDPYTAGHERSSDNGLFTVRLTSFTPNPHVDNTFNSVEVVVLDADGAPLDDVSFDQVEPFARNQGHGTPVVPTVEPLGEGAYLIGDIAYVHRGTWELRLTLSANGASDTLAFAFCVEAGVQL
jgi:hypothetical protein